LQNISCLTASSKVSFSVFVWPEIENKIFTAS
jgi:hypothetical protein